MKIMSYTSFVRFSKYAVAFIGFVIGTEIIYNYGKILYFHFKKNKSENIEYCRVIFFPDEGLLTIDNKNNNIKEKYPHNACKTSVGVKDALFLSNYRTEAYVPCNSKVLLDDIATATSASVLNFNTTSDSPQLEHLENDCDMMGCITSPCSLHSTVSLQDKEFSPTYNSPYHSLSKSTSLIHMIHVLDSAKKTLDVCVYLLSCTDLLEAIIRAKDRGVKVRVILDKTMSSVSKISPLLHRSIPIRYSKPSQMMHNKFAVIDGPLFLDNSVDGIHSQPTEIRECRSIETLQKGTYASFMATPNKGIQKCVHSLTKDTSLNVTGILMTGSFNWTWSGVICNHENVIITNNYHLVFAYAKEYEKLWKLFDFIPPRKQ